MSELRMFPIQRGPAIPWDMIKPHEHQVLSNHGQTLERMAQRGGLGVGEAVAALNDWSWDQYERHHPRPAQTREAIEDAHTKAIRELQELVDVWQARHQDATIATLRADLATAQATIAERDKVVAEMISRNASMAIVADQANQRCDAALARETALREALEKVLRASCYGCYKGNSEHWYVCREVRAALSAAQPPAAAALEDEHPDDLLVALMAAKRGFLRLSVHHRDDHHAPDDMPTDGVVRDGWMALCRIVTKLRLKRGDSWTEIFQDSPIQATAALERREAEQRVISRIARVDELLGGVAVVGQATPPSFARGLNRVLDAHHALAALDAPKEPA